MPALPVIVLVPVICPAILTLISGGLPLLHRPVPINLERTPSVDGVVEVSVPWRVAIELHWIVLAVWTTAEVSVVEAVHEIQSATVEEEVEAVVLELVTTGYMTEN
jgi:hypothetical protein